MAGLGLLFAGLSGAGKSIAEDIGEKQKNDHAMMLMKERADLEEQKQLAIDAAKRSRDAADRTKQGADISAGVTNLQNERDAAAINAKEGSNMTAADAAVLRNNPEARKAYGLLSATATESDMRQSQLRDEGSVAGGLGYSDVEKTKSAELRTEVQDARAEAATKDANRRMDENEAYRRRSEARRAAIDEARLQREKDESVKTDAKQDQIQKREERLATSKNLDSVTQDIKALESSLKSAKKDFDDAGIKEATESLSAARTEAAGYRKLLQSVGIKQTGEAPAKDKPVAAPYADGTRLRKGDQIYVVRNGIPVLEGK